MLIPVLLAGGHGARLWPASRQSRPKQFLPLLGGQRSLLSTTLERLQGMTDLGEVLATGNEAHRFMLAEQIRAAGHRGRIILEPRASGTAAAIAAAALEAVTQHGHEAELLVLPTDHQMTDEAVFLRTVEQARSNLEPGRLVLFGVKPDRSEAGYGYMRAGGQADHVMRPVQHFEEKPEESTAREYLVNGDYYWNSGIILCRAVDYLDRLAEHAPAIHEGVNAAYDNAGPDIDFLRLDGAPFEALSPASVDRVVLEHADRLSMTELKAGWFDLGNWTAVAQATGHDQRGNSVAGDTWLSEVDDCIVHSESRLVAALGTDNQIIVETPDAVLVADRDRAQEIKPLVAQLKSAGRQEATEHNRCYRPWGSYQQIAAGPRFQVKRIQVIPGGQLSLQAHHHRAEHWVVVHGTARVTCDDRQWLLTENQSTYIPLGSVHRLEIPCKVELEVIEVQSGSYLGEDDIVRYDDVYGRSERAGPNDET